MILFDYVISFKERSIRPMRFYGVKLNEELGKQY